MPEPLDGRPPCVEDAIERRVGERADAWFPGIGRHPTVRLRRMAERPRAVLYAVSIGTEAQQPQVLAKVRRDRPTAAADGGAAGSRPRLVTDTPSTPELTALEYAGLTEIHRIFQDDHRFTTVRPLDHLVPEDTILMEYVDAPTLRTHLMAQSRFPRRRRVGRDSDVWERAGAWLRVFQREMPHASLPPRQATRQAVVQRFEAYGDFLSCRLGSRAVGDVARRGAELAEKILPEHLPLVASHGDYAPRNVFVGAGDRPAVFDLLPRWQVPRYEDLARFLVAVRLSGSQVLTQGAAYATTTLDQIERQVIDGYRADETLRLPDLRCYQVLITLDRWSAVVASRSGGWRARVRAAPVELASRCLRGEADRLIDLARSPS